MQIIPKKFAFSNVEGITLNQLNQHYQLYLGYISLLKNILNTLATKDQTNYEYRGLKNGETYALNGIILHELYFANLGQSNTKPCAGLIELIKRDFGSTNNWFADFIRCGKNARGWAVLAYNFRDERLHNIMQDTHNQGSVWDSHPILVLDVYEHAYMIDFGINKQKYLDIFQNNINWKIVNNRFIQIFPYKY